MERDALYRVPLLVGLFNVYIEEWRNLKGFDFKSVALLLLLGLLLSYTALILRLTEQLGINKRRAFGYSFLPIVYALAVGLAATLPDPKTEENPPLVVYIFIVLILVIHIPAFAFGKSQAIKTQGQLANRVESTDYPTILWRPLLALGAPLLATFTIQTFARDDWRLFGSDFVFTAAITCLLVIGTGGADVSAGS